MGDRRGIYGILVTEREGKRQLGKTRHRWEENIKLDVQKVGCCGTDWIKLARDRDSLRSLVNVVMNLQVP
jgi:threonine dehydrogenase-like Zn-dependent dehydrogenase